MPSDVSELNGRILETVNNVYGQLEVQECNVTGVFDTIQQGPPGITPHIGQNGNWFIGSKDTGVSASGSSGGNVIVDELMSDTSTNPVQNRVVKKYIDNLIGDVESLLEGI